jgi:alpha-tubulin suppressor-like RCC1 family protein
MRYATVTVIARDMGEARMKHITNKFFTDIHCGGYHTVALTSKAKVFAWGKNKCAPRIIARLDAFLSSMFTHQLSDTANSE